MSKETLGENLSFVKNIKAQSNILSGLIYQTMRSYMSTFYMAKLNGDTVYCMDNVTM